MTKNIKYRQVKTQMQLKIDIETSLNKKAEEENNKRKMEKNLSKFPSDYTVIDIETTGLSSKYNEIIELSAIKIRNNKIADKFSTLVKPNCMISPFITNLTGITNDMVKNAPNVKEAILKYIDFISDDIVIGHNVNFDIGFIFHNYLNHHKKEFSNNYIDTCKMSKKICKLNSHKLDNVAKHYKIDTTGHHRTENDCIMTNAIYQAMKNEILSPSNNAV